MTVIPAGSRTVVASLYNLAHLHDALHSSAPCVLLTNVHIGNIASLTQECHAMGKPVFVRPDLVEGLKSDQRGILLLRQAFGVDGVFTSSVVTGNHALEAGLDVFWRVFLLDSRALETSLSTMPTSRWTGFEIVPGPMALTVAGSVLQAAGGRPVIAGGFVSGEEIAGQLFDAGYSAVNTSSRRVWDLRPGERRSGRGRTDSHHPQEREDGR